MRRHASHWTLLLAIAGALCSGCRPCPRLPIRPMPRCFAPDAKSAISRQLEQAVLRGDTPGVVALVTDRDGTIFEATAGKLDANGTPMPANAIFNIASMTKPVTSVAIMMLLEQGKIGLDDPVSKYLPAFARLQVMTRFNEADGQLRIEAGDKGDDPASPALAHLGHRLRFFQPGAGAPSAGQHEERVGLPAAA